MILNIKKLINSKGLELPNYATENSAGFDLLAANIQPILIKPKEVKLIPMGFAVELKNGFEMQIRPRSGLAIKYAVTVINSPGTIDSDYRGEVKVLLINYSDNNFIVTRGMRIAQAVVTRYEQVIFNEVESLSSTSRGDQGFGSTGV